MSRIDPNEKAGAATTATGPDDAKACDLAFPNSTNDGEPPDGGPSDADGIDGADLLNRVRDFANRFICYPSETAGIVHVL